MATGSATCRIATSSCFDADLTASLSDIATIARQTVDALPEPFRPAAQSVLITVQDWANDTVLRDLGISDPIELTGLYEGVPVPLKSVSDPDPGPDIVYLFRKPMLAELAEREGVTLREMVEHVTIHEFAHHFGWSDEDIARIERWWE